MKNRKGKFWYLAGWVMGLCVLTLPVSAQHADPGLQASWKYLRNFTFVHVDERDRIFQCRIVPELHVFFATGVIAEGGQVAWDPVRFFTLYGEEYSPSGQDWGVNTIELRGRVMFLTLPPVNGREPERMEFDRVSRLPTLCEHYLNIAWPE